MRAQTEYDNLGHFVSAKTEDLKNCRFLLVVVALDCFCHKDSGSVLCLVCKLRALGRHVYAIYLAAN